MSYVTLARFRELTVMPSADVNELEIASPGWIQRQCDARGAWLDSKLAKRYAVPFASPPPVIVELWVVRLVTPGAYLQRGVNATDAQFAMVAEDAKSAESEIADAANANAGHCELPMRADLPGSTGVVKGGVKFYSEPSPYEWKDRQREAVRWR